MTTTENTRDTKLVFRNKFAKLIQCDYEHQVFEEAFEKVDIDVDTVLARQIPLPFPLLKEESEWYDGSAIESIGFSYTELLDGMRETLAWFQANWR